MALFVKLLLGPVLSIVAFLVTYYLNLFPNNETAGNTSSLAAFFFSIVVLLATQIITTYTELKKSTESTKKVYDAVKGSLTVVPIGNPEKAWTYILDKLDEISFVQNTSFNLAKELPDAQDRFYSKDIYAQSASKIAPWVKNGGKWRDIGDKKSNDRFQTLKTACRTANSGSYRYNLVTDSVPVLGFTIIEFCTGEKEVLFNWDFHFQNIGEEPVVLLSQNAELIKMFSAYYQNLLDISVEDYSSIATRSTS